MHHVAPLPLFKLVITAIMTIPHHTLRALIKTVNTNIPTYLLRYGFLCAVVTLTVGACHRTQAIHTWDHNFLAAASIQDSGHLDEAEHRYVVLLESTPDRAREREIRFELGRISLGRGDYDEALVRFEEIWREPIVDSTGARAMYESARLVGSWRGDDATAVELYQRVIVEYAEMVAADFALQELRKYYVQSGKAAQAVALFEALAGQVSDKTMHAKLLYERALLEESELSDFDAALHTYYRVYRHCVDCPIQEDAVWQMAQIFVQRQQWESALALLELLAHRTETAWFVGTYNSPWASKARLQRGKIYLLYIGDFKAAQREFEHYVADFPEGFETSKAAWHLVEAKRLMGDESEHRRALHKYIQSYPEGRHVAQAKRRLGIEP